MGSVSLGAVELNGLSHSALQLLPSAALNNFTNKTKLTFFARFRLDDMATDGAGDIITFNDGSSSGGQAVVLRVNNDAGANKFVQWQVDDANDNTNRAKSIDAPGSYVSSQAEIAVACTFDASGTGVDGLNAYVVGDAVMPGPNQTKDVDPGGISLLGSLSLKAPNGSYDARVAEIAIFEGILGESEIDDLDGKAADEITTSATLVAHYVVTKDIVRGIIASVDRSVRIDAERAEAARAAEERARNEHEQAHLRRIAEARRDAELSRRKRLLKQAEDWEQAQRLAAYLSEFRQLAEREELPECEREAVERWVHWAESVCSTLSPLIRGPWELLSETHEPEPIPPQLPPFRPQAPYRY